MSKRYGRNQKRKHRAAVAALSQRNEELSKAAGLLRHEVEYYKCAIDRITSAVESICYYSAALPPKSSPGDTRMNTIRLAVPQDPGFFKDAMAPLAPTVDLRKLECFMREHKGKLRAAVHLRLHDVGESAYMISKEAFYSVNTDALAKYFGNGVTEQLIDWIKQ